MYSLIFSPMNNAQIATLSKHINWFSVGFNVIIVILYLISTFHVNKYIYTLDNESMKDLSIGGDGLGVKSSACSSSWLEQVHDFHTAFKDVNSDKIFGHGYQFFYGPHFAPYKHKKFRSLVTHTL